MCSLTKPFSQVEKLCRETRKEYLQCNKKAVIAYVLGSHNCQSQTVADYIHMPKELKVAVQPWNASFQQTKNTLEASLHLCSSSLLGVLAFWASNFVNQRLVKTAVFLARTAPMELPPFNKLITSHYDETQAYCFKTWLPEVYVVPT